MERRAEEQRLAVLDPLAEAVVEVVVVVVVAVEPVAGAQSDFHFHQLNRMLLKNELENEQITEATQASVLISDLNQPPAPVASGSSTDCALGS